jgi:hypothetical protein
MRCGNYRLSGPRSRIASSRSTFWHAGQRRDCQLDRLGSAANVGFYSFYSGGRTVHGSGGISVRYASSQSY